MKTEQNQRLIDKLLEGAFTLSEYDYRRNRYVAKDFSIMNYDRECTIDDLIMYGDEFGYGLIFQEEEISELVSNLTEQDVYDLVNESKVFKKAVESIAMDIVKDFFESVLDKNYQFCKDREYFEKQAKMREEREAKAELKKEKTNKTKVKKLIAKEVQKILKPKVKRRVK